MWEENIYLLTGFWALPSTATGVLQRITIPNDHKILKNGQKSVQCASAQTNSQCSNWCHSRTRCTKAKKGIAEQVALPERSQLEYELVLANIAGKKVCIREALHVKCSWSLIQFQMFADMDTITKEAQNMASLDGAKKSNVKFRKHDLWGKG